MSKETPWEFSRPNSFETKELQDMLQDSDKPDIIAIVLLALQDNDESSRNRKIANIQKALDDIGKSFPTDAEIASVYGHSQNASNN